VLLVLTTMLFFGALAFRLLTRRSKPGQHPEGLKRRHLQLAKVLVGALLAMMVINFNLRKSLNPDEPPSFWETQVRRLAGVFER
jgi:hypothetical protein